MGNNLKERIIGGIYILTGISVGIWFFGSVTMLLALWGAIVYEWWKISSKNIWMCVFGLIYISSPFLFWIFMETEYFTRYIFWIFSIVWSADIGAYFGGKAIGGPKFAPKISPNKTWSGVVVGMFVAVAVSSLYYRYVFLKFDYIVVCVSILLAISAILGDLLESKVKRILNVKDSGNIIRGHGGFLDRFDSFLLASIVFFAIRGIFP